MASTSRCLICNAPPSTTLEDVKVEKVWGREMEVLFALQQVLQVPASLLAKFLAESATGNVGLLTLCHACRQLVGECREVDEELQKLKRRWIECCARVVAKVKSGEEDESPEQGPPTKAEDLRKETRRFVINHAYPFGELKRLLDNPRAERPEEEPEESNGSADTSANDLNVVAGEVAPGVPTDGGVPVPEAVPQDIIEDRVSVTPTTDDNAEGDRVEVSGPAQAAGESGDVLTTREIAIVTGSGRGIEVADERKGIAPARKKEPPTEVGNRTRDKRKLKRNKTRPAPEASSLECLFCLKKFQCNGHLEDHMRVHTRERPFWCGVCGKEFSRKGNLKMHRRTHTGEKPHQCKLCPKRFTQRSDLSRHVGYHLGEKPWKCPDCGKAFVQKSNLTKHRVVHTGKKPYQCDLCPKKYSHPSALLRHKKHEHLNK